MPTAARNAAMLELTLGFLDPSVWSSGSSRPRRRKRNLTRKFHSRRRCCLGPIPLEPKLPKLLPAQVRARGIEFAIRQEFRPSGTIRRRSLVRPEPGETVHPPVALKPRETHGIGLERRHLAAQAHADGERDAVESEMRADVPAAPPANVAASKPLDGALDGRLVGAPPVRRPWKERPAGALGRAAANPDWDQARYDGDEPSEAGAHLPRSAGRVLSASSSRG